MNVRKFATITLLVLSSFAANNVAPSKAELESMYDRAFKEFNANNFPQALKELDAIDARQPDLAESQNLRGVIMMRQGNYDEAEKALQKALATDPKFWNARFNLAEIPFLKKNWTEARNRFQGLLFGNDLQLQGEALQLIQYKVLLTYLLEGKENMVDSIMAKLELAPDTPAVHYANAAMAFQHKNEGEAKDWLTKAEKNFSPQLNKLFAESLYEVGWMEKPAGQTRAAVELTSAADRAAKAKAFARSKFERAEQAFQQRDYTAARKAIEEAEQADPNQAAYINLRGDILLAQKDFDGAEAAFKQALKVDPKFNQAQYNLAQIPLKKKDYAKARERFEALFNATPAPNGDKNQGSQLIKFNIYLTLLLEGKDSRAQKMMEQFQFTGDTPALYYAQAAWEFKHNNAAKANEWVSSARKIYPPAMNVLFAQSFYDLGWLQNATAAPAQAPVDVAKVDSTPSVEPTPIPGAALASNNAKQSSQKQAAATEKAASTENPVPGMEATTERSPVAVAQTADKSAPTPAASLSPSVETPVAATASPADQRVAALPQVANETPAASAAPSIAMTADKAATTEASAAPPATAPVANQAPAATKAPAVAETNVSATPATVLAPATVREWSQPTFAERIERFADPHALLVGGLLVAGMIILAWVVIPELRRRMARQTAFRAPVPASGPKFGSTTGASSVEERVASRTAIAGGPRQISLQLKASEPSVRRAAVPFSKPSQRFGSGGGTAGVGTPVEQKAQAEPTIPAPIEQAAPVAEFVPSFIDAPVEATPAGEPEQFAATQQTVAEPEPEAVRETPPQHAFEAAAEEPAAAAFVTNEQSFADAAPAVETVSEPPSFESTPEPVFAASEEPAQTFDAPVPIVADVAPLPEMAPIAAFESVPEMPAVSEVEQPAETPAITAAPQFAAIEPAPEAVAVPQEIEPIGQGQPVPHLVPAAMDESTTAHEPVAPQQPQSRFAKIVAAGAALAGVGALRRPSQPQPQQEAPVPQADALAPADVSSDATATEPLTQQTTPTEIMPPTTQPTPAPTIRTNPQAPMTGGAPQGQPQPQAAGGMHTAVQLTYSFEIAALQLTPSFKMGALQLRPTSKIVSMRLAPSQQPQPAMNLQVTFEIASVQLTGNAIGTIRLTPSQQQRPNVTGSPAFNIAGLQVLSGSESGAVQLTPAGQGQTGVQVTGRYQIATVEFSPSFEIAAIVLSSTSRQVAVQLPGAAQGPVESAPMFDIANVQLGGNGEIGTMQLTAPGAGQRPA